MKCSRWRADSAPTCIMGNSHFSLAICTPSRRHHLQQVSWTFQSWNSTTLRISPVKSGDTSATTRRRSDRPDCQPVEGCDAQILSHVSLRSALPSVTAPSSPVRKSTLGLNIATPDPSESVVMDSVGSPVIGLPLPELPAKWSLPPSVSFVEWQPKSIVLD